MDPHIAKKTLTEIQALINLWKSGKVTNESALVEIDKLLRKSK